MTGIQKFVDKIIIIGLLFMLLLTATGVQAAENNNTIAERGISDDAIFELMSLGVIRGDENGNLRLEDEINRAEFALVIARLIQCDTDVGVPNQFSDVLQDAEYAPAVNALASYGILDGDGDGRFRPQDSVTEMEVIKVLVSVLGYQIAAIENGGYPIGYRIAAARIGLSVPREEGTADRNFVVQRAGEALNIELLEPAYYGGEDKSYVITKDKTLRSILYQRGDRRVINETGVVTATRGAFFGESVPEIAENQIMINGKLYLCEKVNPEQYFGRQVEFFAEVNQIGGQGVILGIRQDKDTSELQLTRHEIESIKKGSIRYYDEQSKSRERLISEDALLIKNGRRVAVWDEKTIELTNGSLTLIDHDGDKKTDLILWDDFQSTVVERVGEEVVYLEKEYSFDGKLTLNLEADGARYVELIDEDGSKLAISDLAVGDVLSVAMSEDKEYYRIYRSNLTVTGSVEKVMTCQTADNETCYYIDGQEIVMEIGRETTEIDAGDIVTLKLNYMGDAVAVEYEEDKASYGWIYQTNEKEFGAANIRVLMAGRLAELQKIDDTDPDNIITTPYLRAANAGVETYDVADKVTVDGNRMNAKNFISYVSKLTNKMIKFHCDDNGKITRVEFLVRSGEGDSRYYNSYEKTFGKIGTSAFGTTEETYVVCVPTNSVFSERDFCAGVELDVNNQLYQVSGYDVDEETHIADAVVIYAALDADATVNITDNTDEAVVESVERQLQEDGQVTLVITLWCDGTRETLHVSENSINQFEQLRPGSVFRYALNGGDELSEMILDETISKNMPYYKDGSADSYMSLYGGVEEIEYKDLSFSKNRYVHRLTVVVDEDMGKKEIIDINVRNTPPIYFYDMRTDIIKKMTPEEIEPGEMSVFVKVIQREAKVLVFVKTN